MKNYPFSKTTKYKQLLLVALLPSSVPLMKHVKKNTSSQLTECYSSCLRVHPFHRRLYNLIASSTENPSQYQITPTTSTYIFIYFEHSRICGALNFSSLHLLHSILFVANHAMPLPVGKSITITTVA